MVSKIAVPLSSLEFVISLAPSRLEGGREDDDLCHLYYHPDREGMAEETLADGGVRSRQTISSDV